MNLLIDRLPQSVILSGKEYEIDTDYSTSIRFEQLMLDSTISQEEKRQLALNLYYPTIPDDTISALKEIQRFYSFADGDGMSNKKGSSTKKRIYDFEYDAPYIYAAFRADYNIDLTKAEHLHWWVFRSLFSALNEQNMICRIMSYRGADLKHFKGEEQKFYRSMQKQFAIPLPKSEREKANAVTQALLNGGDVSNLL